MPREVWVVEIDGDPAQPYIDRRAAEGLAGGLDAGRVVRYVPAEALERLAEALRYAQEWAASFPLRGLDASADVQAAREVYERADEALSKLEEK